MKESISIIDELSFKHMNFENEDNKIIINIKVSLISLQLTKYYQKSDQ